jgi:DNA-binding transcriptional LysR family regulator
VVTRDGTPVVEPARRVLAEVRQLELLALLSPPVDDDDLEDEPLLLLDEGHCRRDQVVEFCRIADARARELIRSSRLETLRNMVVAGIGCTLRPELAVREGVSRLVATP